jgi:hypothetical protein
MPEPQNIASLPSRQPETIADLDAERLPSLIWGPWRGWRIASWRHWPRYAPGDVVWTANDGGVTAVSRARPATLKTQNDFGFPK